MVAAVSAYPQDDNNGNGAPLKMEHKGDMEQNQESTGEHGGVNQGGGTKSRSPKSPGKTPESLQEKKEQVPEREGTSPEKKQHSVVMEKDRGSKGQA